MLAMSVGFALLYSYVARRPVQLADGVDPAALRASIVRFSAVGILLYVATLVVALFSAPLCLLAHFMIVLRSGSPAAADPPSWPEPELTPAAGSAELTPDGPGRSASASSPTDEEP